MQNSSTLRTLIALSIIPGLGTRRVRSLLKETDDVAGIFKLSKAQLRSVEGIGEASILSILSFDAWESVDEIIERTQKSGSQIITLADDEYPALLKQIYDPPVLFWIKGNPEALSEKGVAVIGTRNPTSYGKKMAEKFSTELAQEGLCIFSGLAYGIDTIAHKSALEVGGKTVAVLGSGIDNLYPKSNAGIANQIVKSGGAVITEFPMGTNPDAGNFPIRNRIVSGLSLGVLVIESGIQGGSMITADLALDQNREVFAIPQTLENPSGSGCNYLIKKGTAKLVQTIDDILEEIPIELTGKSHTEVHEVSVSKGWRERNLDDLSCTICELLEKKATQIDDLSDLLKVNTSQLLVALLQLEMQGLVSQKAGKIFELK